MEANALPAGSWNRRLRPPGPRVGAEPRLAFSPAVAQSLHRGRAHGNQKSPPLLTSALARGQRGSAISVRQRIFFSWEQWETDLRLYVIRHKL
eukprot:scaffold74523_cov70-Phaeocystis_antarctica.AAC.2